MEVSNELFDSPERAPPHCPLSDFKLKIFLKMARGLLYLVYSNKHITNLLHISTTADLTMRLLLLLTEQSKEGGLGDADNLETDTGDITDSVTRTTETSNKDFIVFIDVVQATIARDESGDLLTVLNELDTDALTNSRVRLLSFNTTMH